jgi:hypothetical protein
MTVAQGGLIMHGTTKTRPAARPTEAGVNAVVWIEPGRAVVVRGGAADEPSTTEVEIPHEPAATPPALADVAHRIGAVDRVLVMGTEDLRTALEREIVAIGHRPETIREVTVEGPVDEAALIARLRRLA